MAYSEFTSVDLIQKFKIKFEAKTLLSNHKTNSTS